MRMSDSVRASRAAVAYDKIATRADAVELATLIGAKTSARKSPHEKPGPNRSISLTYGSTLRSRTQLTRGPSRL